MTNKYTVCSQWTTRGGWRAIVVDVLDNERSSMRRLCVWHSNECKIVYHTTDGKSSFEYDLIKPYTPPPEPRSGWVNVLENEYGQQSGGQFCNTRKSADLVKPPAGYKRIACVKWKEGEGLEGEE